VSDRGEVAVVAARPRGSPIIWTRSKFGGDDGGRWTPVGYGEGRLLYQNSELLQLRTGDLYRVQDGAQLTAFGDIADAAATPDELVVARPWGSNGAHVFFRVRDGRARQLLMSWQFILGTLAAYDFGTGKGSELYWAEADGKASCIKRLLFSRPWEVEVVREQTVRILGHPIARQRRGQRDVTAWVEETLSGPRAFWRRFEEGSWTEELDKTGEVGAGAISYSGRWEAGWDRLRRKILRARIESSF
jgi:hypothetical protein